MKSTQKSNFIKENQAYIVIGITGVLIIVLLVLILGRLLGGKKDETKPDVLTVEQARKDLQKDTTPALEELIQQYYTAKSACDLTTLEQIVVTISDEEKEVIRRKKDYIEGYQNIVVYSKKSPVKGEYLVFAGFDIKFKNEAATVPGLETFYVKTSDEGNMYIYTGVNRGEEAEKFIDEQLKSAAVVTLFQDVDNRYVDALASSPALLSFMEGFGDDQSLIEKAKKKAEKIQAQANAATEKPKSTKAPEKTEEPDQKTEEPQATEAVQNEPVNEKVLIVARVNLRAGNDESAEKLLTMDVGGQADRIEVMDNGWSKVQYNGTEGYVKSDYITTFKLTSDTVKTTTTINVRKEASETADMAGQVAAETTLTRYAVCDNGWSQVSYNGSAGFVKTEYLTQ